MNEDDKPKYTVGGQAAGWDITDYTRNYADHIFKLEPPDLKLVGHVNLDYLTVDGSYTEDHYRFMAELEVLMERYHVQRVDVSWKREW